MKHPDILSFEFEYAWLSNFYPSVVKYRGIVYPTVEHAYQAQKFTTDEERLWVASLPTPGKAKRAGAKAPNLPEDWEQTKIGIMRDLVRQKFGYGPNPLFDKLLATGDCHIEEGNWWGDDFWGTCHGKGLNILGRIIMEVRENCKKIDEELRK